MTGTEERADVLAYLQQRQRAAQTIADHNPGERDRAAEVVRSVGIEIEFIRQGLHEGAAATQAALSLIAEAVSGRGKSGHGD
jgi:hypothetical protein